MAGGGLPILGPAIGHILNVRNGSEADIRPLAAGMGGKRTLSLFLLERMNRSPVDSIWKIKSLPMS